MSRTTIPAVTAGTFGMASWATAVKGNDEDHETRVLAVEAIGLHKATVTLTNAQIKALPTTPFTLVAAPGSGKRIALVLADAVFSFAAGAYTNVNAAAFASLTLDGNLASSYLTNDATPTPALAHLTALFGAALKMTTFVPYQDTSEPTAGWGLLASETNVTDNKALVLTFDNGGSGDLTGGNAANTLIFNVLYLVI